MGDPGERGMTTSKHGEYGNPQRISASPESVLRQAGNTFPPSHPEDHAIKLIPGAPETINCKVYPLTLVEQEAMRKFLAENE
jgi:hypothetical protein